MPFGVSKANIPVLKCPVMWGAFTFCPYKANTTVGMTLGRSTLRLQAQLMHREADGKADGGGGVSS